MSGSHRRRLLEIVGSIRCNSRLVVLADGTPVGPVTVEHLVPTSGGGTNAVENLALACAGCNHEPGRRHDVRHGRTVPSVEVVTRLLQKWRARLPRPTSTLATGLDERGASDHRDLEIEGCPPVP